MEIIWPKGSLAFYEFVDMNRAAILNGVVIAIDPSSGGSSQPGYAVFSRGVLQSKGELLLDRKTSVFERLQVLAAKVHQITPEPPDVFVIEEIPKGAAHVYLLFSVGAALGSARTPLVTQLPIHVWKAVAKTLPTYAKGNAEDAEIIGLSLIECAKLPVLPPPAVETKKKRSKKDVDDP